MSVVGRARSAAKRGAERVLAVGDEPVPPEVAARFTTPRTSDVGRRLTRYRTELIPWLVAEHPLEGGALLVIERGGTPAAVVLAEQGGLVTTYDLEPSRLRRTRRRLDDHRLDAELLSGPPDGLSTAVEDGSVPWVVLWGCLSGLTVDERLAILAGAWTALQPGGLLTIVDTPNRLWFFDDEMSGLPYFHWLPDQLAARYLPLSPRDEVLGTFDASDPASVDEFVRLGRGVSYHEVDLAIGMVDELDVVSSLAAWARDRNRARRLAWRASQKGRYAATLASLTPWVPPAFLEPVLNVTIEKP